MKKHHVGLLVEKNSFVDNGDGTITFPNGLPITDNSEQRNGTSYDIQSMDISQYNGAVTTDHADTIPSIIGKVQGMAKVGNQVIVNAIQFAVDTSALANLAYNLFTGGYCTDFSIETYGPPPDENGVYMNSVLVGLSAVVVGNNKNAHVNELVMNSIEKSKEAGLDTEDVEKEFLTEFNIEQLHKEKPAKNSKDNKKDKEEDDMKIVSVKNGRDFAVTLKYKNSAGEDTETEVKPGSTLDVSEDQKENVESQVKNAEQPEDEEAKAAAAKKEADDKAAAEKEAADKKAAEDAEGAGNALTAAINAALKPYVDKVAELEKTAKNAFNKSAEEPKFTRNGLSTTDDYKTMDWRDRHAKQINAAWDLLKKHDSSAAPVLDKLNAANLEALKEKGLARNSLTIADFGNFVISPELLTQIQGCRNDYTPLINATTWQETLSTQMAWLLRSGDISMEEVEFCDDGEDGNLKPISSYGASIETSNLMELAAVTPVCNAATRFLAADLLGDVAIGYSNDYDRKRAQLVVARLTQAVESNGNVSSYDVNPAVNGILALLTAYKQISNCTPNGTFIMSNETHATILGFALQAGISGPLAQIFVTGDVPTMFGRPYIVVSNDLMPGLDSPESVTFTVEGQSVSVPYGLFYTDLTKFTGRTSGGLTYDLSTDAAYEDSGVVKSAFQRNELVLRGSFFRGGAVTDPSRVSAILAPGIS